MSTKEEVLARLNTALANETTTSNNNGTVIIGDDIITNTVELNNPGTPSENDYIFVIKVPSTGSKQYVKYTIAELLASLGAEVTEAKEATLEAAEQVNSDKLEVTQMKTDVTEAIEGFDDTVSAAKTDAVSAVQAQQTTSVGAVESAGESAVSDVNNAKTESISAIDTKKTESVSAVDNAKTDALESIEDALSDANSELSNKVRVGYKTRIGDGSSTSFDIHHNMNAEWVLFSVAFANLAKGYYYKAWETDKNTLHIEFDIAPEADSVEVKIIPNVRMEMQELPSDLKISMDNLPDEMNLTSEQLNSLLAILD